MAAGRSRRQADAGSMAGWRRPGGVAGRRVTLSVLAVAAVLAGVVAVAEQLRHPLPSEGQRVNPELTRDPRDKAGCPELGEGGGTTEPLPVASTDLLSCPGAYDGRLVRYEGEAVGQVLVRGDHAWVHLNDDAYAQADPLPQRTDYAGANTGMAARLPASGAHVVESTAGPQRRGDIVAVVGRFHRAMPGSAEAMAIRARRVERVEAGEPLDQRVLADRRVAAIILALLAAAIILGERVVKRRR